MRKGRNKAKYKSHMSKMNFVVLAVLLGMMLFSPILQAATIQDIPDNSLRIGNDIYDINSTNLDNTEKVATSLSANNQVYFRTGGHWYDVFNTSDTDLGDPTKAVSDAVVNAWTGLSKWYKEGTTEDSITGGGTSTVNLATVTAFNDGSADNIKLTFSSALTTTPTSNDLSITRKVDGSADNTALVKGTINWSSSTPTAAAITMTPQVARGAAEKLIKYSVSYKGGAAVEHTAGFPMAATGAPAAPAATIDPITNNISGLNAGTTYEYRRPGDSNWTTYDPSSPPNLPGETILIRVKASGGQPAGVTQTLTFASSGSGSANTVTSVTATAGPISDTVTVTFSQDFTTAPAASDLTVGRKVNAVADPTSLTRGTILWLSSSPKTISFSVTPQITSGPADKNVQYSVAYKGATAVDQAVPIVVAAEVQYIVDWKIQYVGVLNAYAITLHTRYEIDEARIDDMLMNWDGILPNGNIERTLVNDWTENQSVTIKVYDQAGNLRQEKKITVTETQ